MKCYNCGCRLSEKDFCTACGADVSLYKKIISVSNQFYNEGLEKAGVRDLSGAIISLRQSLKFNKNNIDARNLLGLVYFETGEAVAALSEWVISKNLQDQKNIADDYINMIQSNPTRLDTISQTIKKYNQALSYCHQESMDLAAIQLKKVLSLNANYIKAHQLLALLYINSEEWERARKELLKCQNIDANNTITLRYLKEVDSVLAINEGGKGQPKKKVIENRDIIQYQSGNETIIQPVTAKDTGAASVLLNIGIGVVIGVAIACFLILPARLKSADSAARDELKAVSEQLDLKTATIGEMEQRVKELTQTNADVQNKLENYVGSDGALKAVDLLMQAVGVYMDTPEDAEKLASYLEQIDPEMVGENTSEAFQSLYSKMLETVGPSIAKKYFDTGYESYRRELYEEAIPDLQKAAAFDQTNGDALLYLGNCYKNTEEKDKAIEIYKQVIELFPGTERERKAQSFIDELSQ